LYLGRENVYFYHPKLVGSEPDLVFTSALWYFMTPKYPMPSAHAIITGIFKPNSIDKITGADNNFGSTTAIFD